MQSDARMSTWRALADGRMWRHALASPNVLTAAGLAAIAGVGLAMRIVWWYGLVNVDPFAYADAAASIARGLPVFDPDIVGDLYYTQYLRLSLIVPAAGAFAVFGPNGFAATLFPIVCSLAMALVAFAIAVQAGGGRVAGLIAAFLAGVFPLNVINSTQFLPDTVMAFWASLTILLFWRALLSRDRSWRYRAGLFAAVGFTWALAFYGRQTAVGLAIPFAALVVYYWRFDWTMAAGIGGALIIWAGMTTILLLNGGDFLEDIRTVVGEGRGSQPGALGYTDIDWSYFWTLLDDQMFMPLTGLAMLGAFGVGATWNLPGLRRREMGALAILIVGLFFYFEFLMRLPSLYSWWKEPRYILTLVVPLSVMAGIGISRLALALPRMQPLAFACIAGLLALMGYFSVHEVRQDYDFWQVNRVDAEARELAAALDGRSEEPVFIWNDDLARYLSWHVGLDRATVYERSHGTGYLQNRFDELSRTRVMPGGFVVTTSGQDSWFRPTGVPPHWLSEWSYATGSDLWLVPRAPGPVDTEAVEVVLGEDLLVNAVGISSRALLPEHHAVVTLDIWNGGTEPVDVRLGTRCGSSERVSRTVAALPGDHVVSMDVPAGDGATGDECNVVVGAANGSLHAILPIAVGSAVAIEPELLFSHDPALERQLGTGWFRSDQPFFSGGGSAVALEPFLPLALDPGPLEAGGYWLVLSAYDYGTGGTNRVRVSLNGVDRDISWGSSGEPGVVSREVYFEGVAAGNQLVIEVLERQQDGITIDSVVVSTVAPPD